MYNLYVFYCVYEILYIWIMDVLQIYQSVLCYIDMIWFVIFLDLLDVIMGGNLNRGSKGTKVNFLTIACIQD